jgi:small-conductance mechanosensitive channel
MILSDQIFSEVIKLPDLPEVLTAVLVFLATVALLYVFNKLLKKLFKR